MAEPGWFGGEQFDSRERAKSADFNRLVRLQSRAMQEFMRHLFSLDGDLTPASGVVLDGLQVIPDAGLDVKVVEGLGFLYSTNNLPTDTSLYAYQPFGIDQFSGANSIFTLNNVLGGGNEVTYRFEIAPDSVALESTPVQVLDPNGNLDTDTFAKRIVLRSVNGFTLTATPGVVAPLGTSTPPAATAGIVTLAYVTVHDADANSGLFDYVDKRPMIPLSARVIGAPWAMGRVRSTGGGAGVVALTDAVNASGVANPAVGRYTVTFTAPPKDARYYVRTQLYSDPLAPPPAMPFYMTVLPETTAGGNAKSTTDFTVQLYDSVGAAIDLGAQAAFLDGFDFEVFLTPLP